MSQSEEPKAIKVIFTGLDNAGKSSIIATLMREAESIPKLKPTRGVKYRDFEFLGMQIAEWDLGGQKVYRRAYLNKEPERIFGKTEILISVIDVQDEERIPEALDYLKDVFELMVSLHITPSIYIFFHKYDPVSFIGSQAEINNFSLKLRDQIKAMLNYPQLNFYRTSIYDIQTIIIAVSRILLQKNPKSKVIEKAIKDFADRLDIEALELIDDNSLILGSFYRNKHVKVLMNAITPFFLEVSEIFDKVSFSTPHKETPEDQMMIQKFGKFFLFKKFFIKDIESKFYFLNCKNDSNFNKEELQIFVNLVKEILRS